MHISNIILFLTSIFIANAHVISNSTFDKFVSTHKLLIDSREYNLRANNYYQELERVNQINANDSNNWIEELNPMSVWTLSEKSSLLGYNKMTKMAHKPNNKLLWNSIYNALNLK